MATTFRMSANDTVKAKLFNKHGRLLAQVYDSGYTRIAQVEQALLSKCCNPPRETKVSITNEDKQTYWTNR